ncbi:MAG: hypothetical protein EOP84_30905 [Verrucomicrobiaceae bacterium]|nr:MAG: hypothetical protein EOP84_30905 [Verrucomicrobiaceae bacterium]
MMRNDRVRTQGEMPPEDLLNEMLSRGLLILVAPPRSSFVIGDPPMAKAHLGITLGHGTKTSFMPIAFDVALAFSDTPQTVEVCQLSRDAVRRMNEAMTAQSEMIAGRSKELIVSLSRAVPYTGIVWQRTFDLRQALLDAAKAA